MEKKRLGEIGKLPVEHFKKPGRKLCLVFLLYPGEKTDKEYLKKLEKYWDEVETRINSLQSKVGKFNKVYHELIGVGEEKGMELIKKLNKKEYEVIKNSLNGNKNLQATEDKNSLEETTDWGRCLAVNPQNREVLSKISEFYIQALQKREKYIAQKIDETLKENEIGILFTQEESKIKFPSDIEIFRIRPPLLDEINRYIRDFTLKKK
ncbi:MAG: hypothetical protein U9O41_09090 [Candidatus Aerophobetes bacterium]|nr:hypothetical protein [Candidatus Aerophobetes bacterium]